MMLSILAWLLLPLISLASPLAVSPRGDQVIDRPSYSLSYNEDHEVPNWVAYTLGTNQLRDCVDRSDAFKADPLITTGSAALADYKGSGYDRGHLMPAGDNRSNIQAMKDSFYMSNMTPQLPQFNRGRWKGLENLVRAWSLKYNGLYVVTGPILVPNLPTIGANKVSVPADHFKVVIRKEGNTYRGIGFLMSQSVPYPELISYALSINEIEEISGIDFFPFLNDSTEDHIEDEADLSKWDFKAIFAYLPCSA